MLAHVNSARKILYPFSFVYGLITYIRNRAFDLGLLKSKSFDLPVISVGNLSVGGTGKSPMIEYLIRLFHPSYKVAVLSRGYGRKTKGFLLASENSSAKELGDEPLQFYRKFKDVIVAVDERRVNGLEQLQKLKPELNVVLLDDAFQHRYIKAGYNVLLTAYDKLYTDDLLLPAGDLRESRKGADRANVIIISKCPSNLDKKEQLEIVKKIRPKPYQNVFFSCIQYDSYVFGREGKIPTDELSSWNVLMVTGIADTEPMEEFLTSLQINFQQLKFSDHQFIGNRELEKIKKNFFLIDGEKKLILTTEKDYVRNFLHTTLPVYYLPIKTEILGNSEKFNDLIENYVRKN